MFELLEMYWKPFLYFDGYSYSGLVITLWLLIFSVVAGFLFSIPLAVARNSKQKLISWSIAAFTTIFRGTPLYLQLLICYSGIYSLSFVQEQAILGQFFRDGMYCTLLTFSLNTAAYMCEMLAGALKNVDAGEIEAGKSFGMSRFKIYLYIIFPSALKQSIPQYSNEVIIVLHSTTIAFTATVPDILKVARDANSATYMTFQSFGIAAVLYLFLSFILFYFFRKFEFYYTAHLPNHQRSKNMFSTYFFNKKNKANAK